jgi:hypothetical protein
MGRLMLAEREDAQEDQPTLNYAPASYRNRDQVAG